MSCEAAPSAAIARHAACGVPLSSVAAKRATWLGFRVRVRVRVRVKVRLGLGLGLGLGLRLGLGLGLESGEDGDQ